MFHLFHYDGTRTFFSTRGEKRGGKEEEGKERRGRGATGERRERGLELRTGRGRERVK